ncbi:MAG: DNA-3-methyladenine glycosylase I [Saprospiraceae bacterium]|uniref:DNA-3-methyladenine glycosylase I n=1 Tax=Candidatus Opimibacter skivensis TaxID=2982028 RepID=A0A9D7XMZ4_9BACT|nr:DNA-3-methyladenine glycosylase I [Candidatus Opimibacter skivensis]
MSKSKEITRCHWPGNDELYLHYHDTVWGVPEWDNKALFAKLILDGAQAGLSWITILRRQPGYMAVFDNLDPEKIAKYADKKLEKILLDDRIIRNRLKVFATRTNAKAYLEMLDQGIDFSTHLWSFVDGKPIITKIKSKEDFRATSPESDALSKDLKKRGFSFVGSTIIYAFMQAVGMYNDHIVTCFRHEEVNKLKPKSL